MSNIFDIESSVAIIDPAEITARVTALKARYGRPELLVDKRDLTATAKQLSELIAKRNRFFFNGTMPVHIIQEAGFPPSAKEVTTEAVRVLAHEICRPTKIMLRKDKDGKEIEVTVEVTLSGEIANLYLHGLDGQRGLKRFTGITASPILHDDGMLRTASGYDEATGLWCHDVPSVEVPERPSKQQALAALIELRRFFRTFAYADAATMPDNDLGVNVVDVDQPIGLDESTFLVGLLTAVCRASLPLAPGVLATAPNFSGSGTGKGLLIKALVVIASGVVPTAFTGGHDEEELDKRLTSALIEAQPAVFLDNFNTKNLRSDVLASALTENPCSARLFGQTRLVKLFCKTLICATGNAVSISEDMARRLIEIRFDAKCENPEQRPFKPGFLETVYAHRSTLLSHALTVWRWGRQHEADLRPGLPAGSYEVWAQWCRDPLLALGCQDPLIRIGEIKAADPARRKILAVYEAWWEVHRDLLLPVKDLGQPVIQAIDDKATMRDGAFHFSRQFVASWLKAHTNTRVGGYVLSYVPTGPRSKPIANYKLPAAGVFAPIDTINA